jgi:homoserine kinase type II
MSAAGMQFCLRRWPAGRTPDRLLMIYQVLTHAAARGIDYIPVPRLAIDGRPWVEQGGHYWELAPWMPGEADYHAHPAPARLAAAMQALARFHDATADLPIGTHHAPDGARPPAIVERLETVKKLLGGQFEQISAACAHSLDAELDMRAAKILSLSGRGLQPLVLPLKIAARQPQSLAPAIRDVHHDHVLFTGDRVTGLIDFGALRIDTPLADVARLVGSLAADDRAAREHALIAYGLLRPLTEPDRQLVSLLDRCNVVLSGLFWLRWLYLERRDMGKVAPIVARLDAIIARLQRFNVAGPLLET